MGSQNMVNEYKGILFTLVFVNYEKCKLIEEEIMHVFFQNEGCLFCNKWGTTLISNSCCVNNNINW
jgi:hypothetical protein